MMRDSRFFAWFLRNRASVCLSLLILCMTGALEIKQPYFFLKTDNLDQNLPYYLHNARSFLAGEFPLFNFHQFLGTPVFACIQSAALYLPNYLALFCSWLFLGNYYGTMEFIAVPHLLFAALGFYRLMRYLGLAEFSSCFGAVAWAFCGFVIRVGDGWIQVVGYAALFPWLLLYSLRQTGSYDHRGFIILVLLRVSAIFLGNPPYLMYTLTFEALTVALIYATLSGSGESTGSAASLPVVRCRSKAFLFRQGAAYLCTLLLSAPLLLPAFYQMQQSADRKLPLSWEEYSKASIKLSHWLKGLFMPFSTENYLSAGEFLLTSHIGWLTMLFCVAALFLSFPRTRLSAVFLALAVFSFLWANDTLVTKLFYHLPLFNRQRFPFKLLFFTGFFLAVTATYGFDAWMSRLKRDRLRQALVWIVFMLHTGNLLAVQVATPFDTRRVKSVPYLEPLQQPLQSGRIATIVSPDTADSDKQLPLLGFNYATLFDLYHFAGYETLISEKNSLAAMKLNNSADFFIDSGTPFSPSAEDLAYFRKWGVKWYVLEKSVEVDRSTELVHAYSDKNRSILRDDAARPFVFWLDGSGNNGISHSFSTNSLTVTTSRETEGRLLVNVLFNSFFRATVDGRETSLTETADSQMMVTMPSGRHRLVITYRDPYFKTGVYISLGFLLSVCASWLFFKMKLRRRSVVLVG